MSRVFILSILVLALAAAAFAQSDQSPMVEKDIDYNDWNYQTVRTGERLDLRDEIKGKKLVLVVYMAPWCHSWGFDAPLLEQFYQKYKDKGLDIVAVGEYGTVDAMKENLNLLKVTFPVVYESLSRDDKEKTFHTAYRKSTGDTRGWGTPYYVILEPDKLAQNGDTLTSHTNIINGQMIMTYGEKFIREKLGLPPMDTAASTTKVGQIEKCEGAKKIGEIKKP